jgi:hypothetical protein
VRAREHAREVHGIAVADGAADLRRGQVGFDEQPPRLRHAPLADPVSLLATPVRHLMAGAANAGEVLGVLLAAAAVTALFAPVTLRLYEKAA